MSGIDAVVNNRKLALENKAQGDSLHGGEKSWWSFRKGTAAPLCSKDIRKSSNL